MPLAPTVPEAPLPPEAPLASEPPAAPEVWSEEEREELRGELREQRLEHQEERRKLREQQQQQLREARLEAREERAEGRKEWARGRVAYAEGRKQWAEGRIQWAEGRVQHAIAQQDRAEAHAYGLSDAEIKEIEKSVELAMRHVPEVVESCRYPDAPVTSIEGRDGRVTMYICETAGDRVALKALKRARAGIAHSTNLSAETRREVLRDLDREIAELSR
jgi:hypothetical protein